MQNSQVIKRSVVVDGHKTSVSLEEVFWKGLKELATARGLSMTDMVSVIEAGRTHGNLSSAIRMFVLEEARSRAAEVAHHAYPHSG